MPCVLSPALPVLPLAAPLVPLIAGTMSGRAVLAVGVAGFHPPPSARPSVAFAVAVNPPVLAPLVQGEDDNRYDEESHHLNKTGHLSRPAAKHSRHNFRLYHRLWPSLPFIASHCL